LYERGWSLQDCGDCLSWGSLDGPAFSPLNNTSAALKRILMFCCGPRSAGSTACKSGARKVYPDTHVAAGNELQTSFS